LSNELNTEYQTEYHLFPAFPNPFNPVTTISFTIPMVETWYTTSLQIFDIKGKQLEILFEDQLGPGVYSVQWNAPEHPAGIYFVNLTAGHFIQTKKLILLK